MESEKIKNSIWFDQIGIVKIQTESGEIKYYIGKGSGFNKKADEHYIKNWGTPIASERIKNFFNMFSIRQKREIADKIQKILRETKNPELPEDEIQFNLSVKGAKSWSFADIRNHGAIAEPSKNSWNEKQRS